MKNAKLALAFLLIITASSAVLPASTHAETSYKSYVYDEWDKSKAAPNSYLPKAIYSGIDIGAGSFSEPQDMAVSKDQFIYVADTGNNRIVKLDSSFRMKEVIDKPVLDGAPTELAQPTGIFVDAAGMLYIADKGNGRILRISPDNKVTLVIKELDHPLIPKDFVFKPTKVGADSAGRIYVQSEGQFFGLMQFDDKGQFTGYYGSNKVEVTPAVVLEAFWKSILSKEQRDSMVKLLPIEYSNLDVGSDDFVYTTTIVSENSREQIKKLNPLGNNVLRGKNGDTRFGDREYSMKQGVKVDTSFVDIALDSDGFIAALDRTRGHVFEYDQEGNPMAIFGSLGNQKGTFLQPAAIGYLNGDLLVLDSGKRNITRFRLSEYGKLVRQATVLYNQGLYEDAAVIWRQVARLNGNSSIAHVGIAKAEEKDENYSEALPEFRQGSDRSGYSDSFGQIRITAVRNNLPTIMTVLISLLILYYGYKGYRTYRKRRGVQRRKEARL